MPEFPAFKPIELADRSYIHEALWRYQPEISELTFTNLFIWRQHYGVTWSTYRDRLLLVFQPPGQGRYALPPVGPTPRQEVTLALLGWLKEQGENEPRLERIDERLAGELGEQSHFMIEPAREHFDYVYRSQDLAELRGRKYHAKRNFINTFRSTYHFTYEDLDKSNIADCQAMAARWCEARRCSDDMDLMDEWTAVNQALVHFAALGIRGGVIRVEDRVEAFALGELLNSQTAVVHIEKANPELRGIYAVINQQFCEHHWQDVPFVNREQDLGEPQLR